MALLAGVIYAIHFGSWVTSLTLTTVAASVTLVTTNPIILALLGLITGKDRPSRRIWYSIVLALIGLSLIGRSDLSASFDALLGDALALVGAFAMASYLLLARSLGEELNILAFSGVATLISGMLLLFAALAANVPIEISSPEAFGYIVLAALLPQLIGHNILTWSLRYIKPTVVAMAIVGEPVFATILSLLILGETIATPVALGCLVTLSAVAISVTEGTPSSEVSQL